MHGVNEQLRKRLLEVEQADKADARRGKELMSELADARELLDASRSEANDLRAHDTEHHAELEATTAQLLTMRHEYEQLTAVREQARDALREPLERVIEEVSLSVLQGLYRELQVKLTAMQSQLSDDTKMEESWRARCAKLVRQASAYSPSSHSFHARRDRVAPLPPCRFYGAAMRRAPPLGLGVRLTLPCGWNNAASRRSLCTT